MAYANTLKVFEILRNTFDEQQSKKIAEAVETALETNNETLLEKVATKQDLTETKAEIIKWMFISWIGQFASITTVLFLFFKK